jgi:hypothetical protein
LCHIAFFSELSQNIKDLVSAAQLNLSSIRANETQFITDYAASTQKKLQARLRGIIAKTNPAVAQSQKPLAIDRAAWPTQATSF